MIGHCVIKPAVVQQKGKRKILLFRSYKYF